MSNGIIPWEDGYGKLPNLTKMISHSFGDERTWSSCEQSEKPTSEEDLILLLCFYDTYICYYYYRSLLALMRQPRTSEE